MQRQIVVMMNRIFMLHASIFLVNIAICNKHNFISVETTSIQQKRHKTIGSSIVGLIIIINPFI